MSYIVSFWEAIFRMLSWVSPLKWLRHVPAIRGNDAFTDSWVLGNLSLGFLALIYASLKVNSCLSYVLLSWGALRIFETVVYQVNLILFDTFQSGLRAHRSYRRLLILALHNYFEVLVWFAVAYRTFSSQFKPNGGVDVSSLIGSLYYSLVTLSTVGYGDITPVGTGGTVLVVAEILVGLFLTLLILARLVAFLPAPQTLDTAEQQNADQGGSQPGKSSLLRVPETVKAPEQGTV